MVAAQCHLLQPVETLHENKWFSVKNRGGHYLIEYNTPQVIVLPVVDNRAVVMVRVKRPVLVDNTLELPAGGANRQERPVEAAARELREETGIAVPVERFRLLSPITISPNRLPVLPWLYEIQITQQEFDQRQPHDDEIASVECFEFEEVKKLMVQGLIYVSLPMAIISRFLFEAEMGVERKVDRPLS